MRADMLKLTFAFENFVNAPLKALGQSRYYYLHKEQSVKRPVLSAAILKLK